MVFSFGNVTAFGAAFSGSSINGGAGTVYLQGSGRESGELIIDNNNLLVPVTSATPIVGAPTATLALTHFRVRRAARVRLDSSLNLAGTLEVASGGEFVAGNLIISNNVNLNASSLLTQIASTGTASFKIDISTQNLTIDSTSRIDVTGRGFLGGGQPGNPSATHGMTLGFQAVNGSGTAGSYGGLGGAFSGSTNPVYGDFRNPNEVGSGGGGFNGNPAGNGGGLVRIVAQTIVLDGAIRANAGAPVSGGFAAGGSGGGIRIDVGTLSGVGTISANGSAATPSGGGGGGGGRIAIYYQNATGFNFGNATAFGATFGGSSVNGGAGTVYLQGPARESGELVIDNNNLIAPNDTTPIFTVPTGSLTFTALKIRRGAKAKVDALLNVVNGSEISTDARLLALDRLLAPTIQVATRSTLDSIDIAAATSFQISDNSVVAHPATTASVLRKLLLSAGTLTIDATSRIDVTERGFLGGGQPGNPSATHGMTFGFQAGSGSGAGGSYGGLGGGASNPVYGDFRNPNDVGSGGGGFNGNPAGNGGGLVRIVAQTIVLDGAIRANAGAPVSGGFAAGGSGGGIRIDVGTLSGVGTISANGSAATPSGGGGGGGGRIAIYYRSVTTFNLGTQVTATGGIGSGSPNGQNGTIHLLQQIAMLLPTFEEAPVMKAETEGSTGGDSVRLTSVNSFSPHPVSLSGTLPDIRALIAKAVSESAPVDRPQRRVFSALEVNAQNSELKTEHTNLYLAMLASSSVRSSVLSNPKSEIENPKPVLSGVEVSHDDFDPIYTYDLNGNRISMIEPTGLTNYTYDALNRLTSITNNRGAVTTFTYDALGRRTSMTHGNGVVTTYQYDTASQLTRLAHQLGATTINSFDYTYDKIGNRKTKVDRNNGSYNYTYDTLNRLTQALNPLPSNPLENYTYDPVGNRTNSNQNGLSSFNQANQLTEDVNFTYQYDANGNQTRKTAKVGGAFNTYEYDAENKLVRAVSNGTVANYKYDGLGRRIEKEVTQAGVTKMSRYIYDNEDILLELDGSNTILARYTHGPGIDEPLIMEKAGQSFFYHADGLGSITEISNDTGSVVQRYNYSSFGKIESQLDPKFIQPYTFTSREFDPETGLDFYRGRQYDPSAGRFLQEDPIGIIPFSLGRFNHLHVYVENNPITRVDPSGAYIFATAGIGAVIGAVISAASTIVSNPQATYLDVLSAAAAGAAIGAVTGALAGPGLISGVVGGSITGGLSDFAGQVLANYSQGRGLFDNIDTDGVIFGAIGGAISGFGGAAFMQLGAQATHAIVLSGMISGYVELFVRTQDRLNKGNRRNMVPYCSLNR